MRRLFLTSKLPVFYVLVLNINAHSICLNDEYFILPIKNVHAFQGTYKFSPRRCAFVLPDLQLMKRKLRFPGS